MRFQARRLLTTMSSFGGGGGARSKVTGLAPGPFGVGVTTVQFEDRSRDDGGACRKLQTEIWYPAAPASGPPNRYRDFLGAATPEIIAAAERPDAIGGYAEGLTIAALDASWPQSAMRDAPPLPTAAPWPAVVFSHGSGAFRASYVFWTEFLASHGYVVAACDHPGSARFTLNDGAVVTPGGPRSKRARMERDRVADVFAVLDGLEGLARTDSRFAGRVDARNAAVTGMSFGGWTAAAALERGDARVKAGVLMCPSLASSDGGALAAGHGATAPALVAIGTEDTVIGEEGNAAARRYAADHGGPAALLEIVRGGHVSFTSCELYTPTYGNGIGPSKSLTTPGATYEPLPIADQHAVVNSYGLAFLNARLKPPGHALREQAGDVYGAAYLERNHFNDAEVKYTEVKCDIL